MSWKFVDDSLKDGCNQNMRPSVTSDVLNVVSVPEGEERINQIFGTWWDYHFRPYIRMPWYYWVIKPVTASRITTNLSEGDKVFKSHLDTPEAISAIKRRISRLPPNNRVRKYVEIKIMGD